MLVSFFSLDVSALRRAELTSRAPGQVREGLSYVWSRPELRAALILIVITSIFGQNFRVVIPLLATDSFGGDARVYGWMMAALGVGSIAPCGRGRGRSHRSEHRLGPEQ